MGLAAAEVPSVIDDCCWASARYWLIWPGELENGARSPSAFMRSSSLNRRLACSLSKTDAVAGAERPLSLFTRSPPAPLTHTSKYQRSRLIANGRDDTPAAFSFFAAASTSSRVWGGASGSRPAFWKWALL